jgi:hypothetical protein
MVPPLDEAGSASAYSNSPFAGRLSVRIRKSCRFSPLWRPSAVGAHLGSGMGRYDDGFSRAVRNLVGTGLVILRSRSGGTGYSVPLGLQFSLEKTGPMMEKTSGALGGMNGSVPPPGGSCFVALFVPGSRYQCVLEDVAGRRTCSSRLNPALANGEFSKELDSAGASGFFGSRSRNRPGVAAIGCSLAPGRAGHPQAVRCARINALNHVTVSMRLRICNRSMRTLRLGSVQSPTSRRSSDAADQPMAAERFAASLSSTWLPAGSPRRLSQTPKRHVCPGLESLVSGMSNNVGWTTRR